MALTHKQLARLGELLDQSLPLSLDERRAWLETLPAADEALRQTLGDALLAEDPAARAGKLLERPPRATEHRAGERLGAYELLEPLGAGGMAEVWLARRADGAFDRRVALKIPRLGKLPAEMSARFARECHILASLEVPGIARLYDAGISDQGVPYIAMEYVAGVSFTASCDARGLDGAGRISAFLQVLEAVGRAHARGVIHRDLKPSNILVTPDGEVRLLDFGIARLLRAEPDASLTQVWGPAFTPEYASPEMLRGGAVDARSDIYSLGVVLRELFKGVDAQPQGLNEVLARAMAESPDARYLDAAAFAAALRALLDSGKPAQRPALRIGLAAGIAAILVLAGFLLMRDRHSPAAAKAVVQPAREVSMAVLPFADLSPGRDQEYLSEGMADEIINQLAQVPSLRLVGLRSSLTFKGQNEDLRVIGEKLGVDNLLDGTIRKDGDRLRITAQLVRARDGTPLWSSAYDRELRDVFKLQEDIARDVAHALSVKLDVGPNNSAQGGTTNLDAYDRYLRWRQMFLAELHSDENHRQRAVLLREAVQFDPRFALAWGELGAELDRVAHDMEERADRHRTIHSASLREEAGQARAKAMELAPQSWIGLRIRSEQLANEHRWAESIDVARQILDTGPFTLERAYPLTNVLFAVGRFNEVIELVDRVIRIEPLAMFPSRDQQWNLTAARRYAESATEYERSRQFEGQHTMPEYIAFLRTLALDPSNITAIRETYEAYRRDIGPAGRDVYYGELAAVLHDREALRAKIRQVVTERRQHYDYAYGIADAIGEPELALDSVLAMLEQPGRDFQRYYEPWIIPYSTLRTLPRFKQMLIDAKIADYWRTTGKWGDFCKPVSETDFECH